MKKLKELLNEIADGWYFWPLAVILFFWMTPLSVALVVYKLFSNRDEEDDDAPSLTAAPREMVDTRINKPKTAQTGPEAARSETATEAKPRKKRKKAKKHHTGFLMTMGTMLALFGAIWIFADFLVFGISCLAGGAAMLIKGWLNSMANKRYARYMPMIGDRDAVDVDALARMSGQSREQVLKDLVQMIDMNYFEDSAYLNRELGYLFRSNKADQEWREKQRESTRNAAKTAAAPKEAEEGYSGILRNIRRANDRIADPILSEKIDRLENITARIFRAVEADPKKAGRIETFLTYYLPTTQKLLDSYAQFEEAGVEGENLSQAKERISTTMDMILDGFSRQLDSLYKADAMDVDSDIRVMETMLRRDVGTVADDFGMTGKRKSSSGRAASSGRKENTGGTAPSGGTAAPSAAPTQSGGTRGVLDEDPFGLWGDGGSAVQRKPGE